jgi:hypothetical protein
MDKREEMIRLVEEFNMSGLTQKDFSASKGMGFHQFNYWYRKLKRENVNSEASGFIRVDTGRTESPTGQFELEYPNGVKLRVPKGDFKLLYQLIALY